MPGLLDVILGYDCNLACDYCTITPAMRERSLGAAQVVAALRQGRADGLDRAAFTGGEPTIRGDLLGLVRAARTLGYDDVKVQTNGLVLGQGDNAGRLAGAGATRLHISVHTHVEDRYEALVRSVGSFARLLAGLVALVGSGLPLGVDVFL